MFSWNWAATESASVVGEAVTIAVASHAPPLAKIFIVSVAYDTTDAVLAVPRRLFANPDGYPHSGMYDTLAHRIRHSYDAYLLRCGTSLETIRRVLGHSYIITTIGNLHVTEADLSDAIDRAFEQPDDDAQAAWARTWQCGHPGGRPHKTGTPASEEAGVPSNSEGQALMSFAISWLSRLPERPPCHRHRRQ
jgi:hypothetical protein